MEVQRFRVLGMRAGNSNSQPWYDIPIISLSADARRSRSIIHGYKVSTRLFGDH